jgi:Arylsulfotransferase (ASST)
MNDLVQHRVMPLLTRRRVIDFARVTTHCDSRARTTLHNSNSPKSKGHFVMRSIRHAQPRLSRLATITSVVAIGGIAAAAPSLATSPTPNGTPTPTAPPPITSLVHGIGDKEGDFFITPTGDTTSYAQGPEIVDGRGNPVWFHAVPTGDTAADFRTQTYNGKPVLTWWQGTGLGGVSNGEDVIADTKGQQIATVTAGNGLTTDGHEFLITPQNTALVLSYDVTTADTTAVGGPADQKVVDGVVQEVNIKTGKVLLSWNSADHVPFSASEQPLPAAASTPWDYFHVNAVHLDTDGSLLIDARNTWATYDVNRTSGAVNWTLGGKDSSFTAKAAPGQSLDSAGEIFSWQHDPEALGHNTFTWFDNDSTGTPNYPYSRIVTVKLDPRNKVATLVDSTDQPDHLSAPSQGNGQTLDDGNLVVGWGALNYFSEFGRSGALLDNLEFPAGVNTYRAYRQPWPAATGSGHRHQHRR